MKKYLLIALTLAFTTFVDAEKVKIDGIIYNLKPAKVGTASVSADDYKGTIKIPSTIEYKGNSYNVTEIDPWAFSYCKELTSVELPYTITTIGYGAFEDCKSLKTINIPSSVKTIMEDAFSGCTGLTSIHIADLGSWCDIDFADYGNPLYYAHHLFINDEEITHLVIPDSISCIKRRAFNGFSALKSVLFGSGIDSIDDYAFAWCSSLTSINIPNNVKKLGNYVFTGCTSLSNLYLPNSIEIISSYSFQGCSGLETITIPNGVKTIESYAFESCTNTKKVYISSSTTKIGANAFGKCENIEDVYCYATDPPTPAITWYVSVLSDYFWQSYVNYATLHIPEASIDSYKSGYFWNNFGTIVALKEEETSIKTPTNQNCMELYYYLNGYHIDSQKKGICIIKMPHGQTKKIIVK